MVKKKLLLSVVFFAVVGVTILGNNALAKAEDGGRTGLTPREKTILEDRKAEIKERLAEIRERNQTRLEDRRLRACEARQQKINNIFSKATTQNNKQLAVFRRIQEKVEKFYEDKSLLSDDYNDAVTVANDTYAAAAAAIEASAEITFDCSTADGTNPGGVIKEAVSSRHEALKAYRTAVKNLILVVKHANGESTSGTDTDTDAESPTPTPTETPTSTPTETPTPTDEPTPTPFTEEVQ